MKNVFKVVFFFSTSLLVWGIWAFGFFDAHSVWPIILMGMYAVGGALSLWAEEMTPQAFAPAAATVVALLAVGASSFLIYIALLRGIHISGDHWSYALVSDFPWDRMGTFLLFVAALVAIEWVPFGMRKLFDEAFR